MLGGGGELVTLVTRRRRPGRARRRRCAAHVAGRWPFVEVQRVRRRPAALPAAGRSRVTERHRTTLDTPLAKVLGRQDGQGAGRRTSTCTPPATCSTTSRAATTSAASTPTSARWRSASRSPCWRRCSAPVRGRCGSAAGNMLEVIVGDGAGGVADADLLQPGVARARPAARPVGPVRRQGDRVPRQAPAQRPGVHAARRRRGRGGRGDRGVRRRADPGLPGGGGRADLGDRHAACGSCWTPSSRRPTRCRRGAGRAAT